VEQELHARGGSDGRPPQHVHVRKEADEECPRVSGEDLKPGTDVMIIKIFSPKNSAKKLAFLTPNKAKLCKILQNFAKH
jgi:hypothetical protein